MKGFISWADHISSARKEFKNYLGEKYQGSIEYQWVETKLWIKLLVDGHGNVYWAGEYQNPKPLLDH